MPRENRKLPVSTASQSVINLLHDALLAVHDRTHKSSFLSMLSWPKGHAGKGCLVPQASRATTWGRSGERRQPEPLMPSDRGCPQFIKDTGSVSDPLHVHRGTARVQTRRHARRSCHCSRRRAATGVTCGLSVGPRRLAPERRHGSTENTLRSSVRPSRGHSTRRNKDPFSYRSTPALHVGWESPGPTQEASPTLPSWHGLSDTMPSVLLLPTTTRPTEEHSLVGL